jgi:hypothetical protein
MAEPFTLRSKVDRPFIEAGKAEDVHVLITIEPNQALLGQAGSLPMHIVLLVDVSASMDLLVRFDPNAETVGEEETEGQHAQQVVSEVPSRREMACNVALRLAQKLQPTDQLTIVAYDCMGYLLAQGISPHDQTRLEEALNKLATIGGGGSNLGLGLEVVRQALARVNDSQRTRMMVLLTDGEDESPQTALEEARKLAQEFNLPMVALGTGECKIAFLTELAKTTLAGAFNHIQHENDADQFFQQVLTGQKNVRATNARLKLWLSPDLHVRELYRTRPEILFVGDLQPDAKNVVDLRLEQMEKGKAYEFLFRCTLPARPANQRLRLAKASLSYDLSGTGQKNLTQEANIVAAYTADANQARKRIGDVLRVLTRAEVQRQVLFLQGKIDLLKQGAGTKQDQKIIATLLGTLIAKFEQFGDQAMANQYRSMREEFLQSGAISQEMLNRSLAASSRAETMVTAQDIDF